MTKRLTVGVLTPMHHLDPLSASDAESTFVVDQVFESPFEMLFGEQRPDPVLFEAPLRDERGDGTVLSATVRADVRFSDGSVLTPQELADSLRRAPMVAAQAKIEVEGSLVRFRLSQPNPQFHLGLGQAKAGVAKRVGRGWIGTGPFLIDSASRPEEVLLRRNPHYRAPVAIEEILFRAYPLDAEGRATALLAAIQRGEVDLCNYLARDDIAQLSGVRKSIQPGVSTAILYLNSESARLADPRLRRALAHAVDRLALARICYSNPLAFTASSLLPRPLGSAADRLGYDLRQAETLLAELGDAVPGRLDLLVAWGPRPYLPQPHAVAQAIAEQLGALGFEIRLVPTSSSAEFLERAISSKHELALIGWMADTMDPADFLESLLASSRIPRWDNIAVSANYGRLADPAMDRALDGFRAKRSAASLQAVVDVLDEQAPLVPLFYGAAATVWSYRVRGLKPTAADHVHMRLCDLDLGA